MSYPLSFTLTIEPRHAVGALRGDGSQCPTTRALRELFPHAQKIHTSHLCIALDEVYYYELPSELHAQIDAYDAKGPSPEGTFQITQLD